MRSLVLEALLDLPLGTSFREVAARVGKHANTLDFHINKLRKTGHVQVVKRGFHKRKTVVPMRARLSETEAEWLKLGFVTARAIVIVARADGRYVTGREVSKALHWHEGVAGYHLGRAVKAGILEGLSHKGYRLARGSIGRNLAAT